MTLCSLLRAAALACTLALSPVLGAGASLAQSRPAGDTYSFAFRDAEIRQAAEEILGNTLGLNFTVDPGVTGKISFRIERRLTRAQLLEAFEAALAASGVVLVRNGDSVVLTPRARARESASLNMVGEAAGQAGYEIVAVPLTYATPSEVAKALQSMGRSEVVIYSDDKLGLVLLGGTAREIEAAQQVLRVLDQSGLQAARIRWFELRSASAQTVAQEMQQVLQASGTSGITVVALRRLNGLLVFARTPRALDEVAALVERLDAESTEEAASLWVYRPQSSSAEALAATLNQVFAGGAAGGGGVPAAPTDGGGTSAGSAPPPAAATVGGGEGDVRIGVNKETNTLIVTAPASKWLQIKRILDEIDVTPSQVLIEASILEVTLGDELRYGVDWAVVGSNGRLRINSSHNEAGTIGPTFPGFSVTYLSDDIRATIDALKSISAVEIVSAPKLVTLDNRVAKLQVGDQVPIVTRSAQGTTSADAPLVVTTEYRDTGIILNVTPRISGAGQVVLEVDQEVSSVARTTTSGIDSPTIQQRRLQSTLVLQDGGTVALGGLISSNRNRGNSGLPFVKDIPVIGMAFRADTNDERRTELIVLMTARIMRDAAAADRVMGELLADMKEIQGRGLRAR